MNPNQDMQSAADAAEVIGKVSEPPKPEILKSNSKFWKSLTISQWASVVNFLTEFRNSSLVRSTSQDKEIKQILSDLLDSHVPPVTAATLWMPAWNMNYAHSDWCHGLSGKLARAFSTYEWQMYMCYNRDFHIKKWFFPEDMAYIMHQYFKNDTWTKNSNWWARLNDEQKAILMASGTTDLASVRFLPRQAYDLICVIKQGAVSHNYPKP